MVVAPGISHRPRNAAAITPTPAACSRLRPDPVDDRGRDQVSGQRGYREDSQPVTGDADQECLRRDQATTIGRAIVLP